MSKYETTGGIPTLAGTHAKLLDLLDQLTDLAKQQIDPAAPRSELYTRMITCIDELIDQSAVIAHLHNTEDTPRDRSLNQGWLAVSFAMQTIRTMTTLLTKTLHQPQAWRDMVLELQAMKHKIKSLMERTLN